jgi:hypothetical protein
VGKVIVYDISSELGMVEANKWMYYEEHSLVVKLKSNE